MQQKKKILLVSSNGVFDFWIEMKVKDRERLKVGVYTYMVHEYVWLTQGLHGVPC